MKFIIGFGQWLDTEYVTSHNPVATLKIIIAVSLGWDELAQEKSIQVWGLEQYIQG